MQNQNGGSITTSMKMKISQTILMEYLHTANKKMFMNVH